MLRHPYSILLGLLVASAALAVTAVACSSKSDASANTTDAGGDAADAASGDANTDAGHFPAFTPDVGQLVKNGGPMIAAPKLVTVTWDGDTNRAALESLSDKIGASAYWTATAGEYGIGALTSGAANHVHIATGDAGAPPTLTGDDVTQLVVDSVYPDGGTSAWPAYDASTIYLIYIPVGTVLTPGGPYHSETPVGSNLHVPFIVIDENAHGSLSVIDAATAAASHEIAETATNPNVNGAGAERGLVDYDADHIAWNIAFPDAEIGDICELNADATFAGPTDLPFRLQRLWSNKSAAAGHNPCIPAPTDPYYNVTPLGLETVSVFVNDAVTASSGLGYRINIGAKKTIKVGFYSDAAISAPWTITAVEGSYFSPATDHRLTINVTKGTGNNGDFGEIEVTANAQSLGAGNAVLMTITSQAPGLPPHAMPVLIGTY